MPNRKLRDTNQSIAKIVKRGCADIANFISLAYSDDILNRTYQHLSELPDAFQVSLQNLLDKSDYNDETGSFRTTDAECEVCIRTLVNAIEVSFFKALQPVMDADLWQYLFTDAPKIDKACFESQPFRCAGETCERTHIETDMTYYRLVDGEVKEFNS